MLGDAERQAYSPDHIAEFVHRVFEQRVVFHGGDGEVAPGVTLHRLPGHTMGMQVVRVPTARGTILLASDAAHYFEHWEFHPEVTTSATRGYYVVYLFDTDMSTLNLCLGQGVTAIRDEFGAKAIDEMLRRAALIRDRVPTFTQSFVPGPAQLGGTTRLSRDYGSAVAFFGPYDLGDLPEEGALIQDLRAMVGLYDLLVSRGGLDNVEGLIEYGADQGESDLFQSVEERRRYRGAMPAGGGGAGDNRRCPPTAPGATELFLPRSHQAAAG